MSDAMNDYLWSAKGEADPFIARLENVLECKRYDPSRASVLVDVDSALASSAGTSTRSVRARRGVLVALPIALAAAGVLLMSLVTFNGDGGASLDVSPSGSATPATAAKATGDDEAIDEIQTVKNKTRRGLRRTTENAVIGTNEAPDDQ